MRELLRLEAEIVKNNTTIATLKNDVALAMAVAAGQERAATAHKLELAGDLQRIRVQISELRHRLNGGAAVPEQQVHAARLLLTKKSTELKSVQEETSALEHVLKHYLTDAELQLESLFDVDDAEDFVALSMLKDSRLATRPLRLGAS